MMSMGRMMFRGIVGVANIAIFSFGTPTSISLRLEMASFAAKAICNWSKNEVDIILLFIQVQKALLIQVQKALLIQVQKALLIQVQKALFANSNPESSIIPHHSP